MLTRLKSPEAAARWLTEWCTGTLRTDSRQIMPGDAFIAWPGYARDGREYVAALILERHWGCKTYVPTETRWRRRNRYCKAKEQFAFAVAPRYVLAGFSGAPHWLFVLDEPAISDVIRLDGQPKRLDRSTAIFDRAGNCRRLTDEFLDRYMARTPNGRFEPTLGKVLTEAMAPTEEQWMKTHKEFKAGDTLLARFFFILDPDGYKIEVLERHGHYR